MACAGGAAAIKPVTARASEPRRVDMRLRVEGCAVLIGASVRDDEATSPQRGKCRTRRSDISQKDNGLLRTYKVGRVADGARRPSV